MVQVMISCGPTEAVHCTVECHLESEAKRVLLLKSS